MVFNAIHSLTGTLPPEAKPYDPYPLRPEDDDKMKTFGRNVVNVRMNPGMTPTRTQNTPPPPPSGYINKYAPPDSEMPVPYYPDGNKGFDISVDVKQNIQPSPPSSPQNTRGGCRCECRLPYFLRVPGAVLSDPTIDMYAYHHQHHQHPHQNQQHQQKMTMAQFSPTHLNDSSIETAGGLASECAVSCEGAYRFTAVERETAFFWIYGTALVCLVTCFMTVFTFIVDRQRFHYPERAIIFLAGCYFFIALAYLLRMWLGHSAIACDGPFIRYQKTGPTPAPCFFSFILLYFFGMASAYWWLILTLTWFLTAGLKWSSEAIASYEQYFHMLAWLLPAVQSVTILSMGAIDADAFVGLCSVGNQSRLNLLVFVIGPLCICIAIGSLLLLAGFVALFRIRRVIRARSNTINVKTDKLEKLMMRIGLSSFLYIVPEVVVVGCHIYEYINRPAWERALACNCGGSQDPSSVMLDQPTFGIILLKYIMSLIIGITSGFWIWSSKTLESWLRISTKLACCGSDSVSGQYQHPHPQQQNCRSGRAGNQGPNGGPLLGANYYGHTPMGMGLGNPMAKVAMSNNNSLNGTPTHHGLGAMAHNLRGGHFGPMDMSTARSLVVESTGRTISSMQHQPLPAPPLPPPPPPLMMGSSHHGGSLTGSQFTHLMTGLNGKMSHV